MYTSRHLRSLSKTPSVAVTNYVVKLEGMTQIIDSLILLPRQVPWKASPYPIGETDTDTGTTIDTGNINVEL